MRRWLWDNVESLLFAFLLALSVWMAGVSATDPIEEREFSSSIPISYTDPADGLLLVGDPPPEGRLAGGDPPPRYQAGTPQVPRGEVAVVGPASIVDKITEAVAPIDLTGADQDIDASVDLAARDASGEIVSGIDLEPVSAR